jgi:HPr kinase/phosphorylase
MTKRTEILHASFVVRRRLGEWRGALLRGPSGVGKSDLALRLLDSGWRLVADDRTLVWQDGEGLFGRAPARLKGLIEARGLGVVTYPVPMVDFGRIDVVVDCAATGAPIERVPESRKTRVLDLDLPSVTLCALDASAPRKLMLAFAVA